MMTMEELVEMTGIPERTIRNYVREGVIPSPQGGLYSDEDAMRLFAITRLHEEGVRSHSVIKARLGAMDPDELESFARSSDDTDDNGVHDDTPPQTTRCDDIPTAPPPSTPAMTAVGGEECVRFVVRPGLELILSRNASPEVRAVAEQILAKFKQD